MDSPPSSSQEMRASQVSLHFDDSGSDKENASRTPRADSKSTYTLPPRGLAEASSDDEDDEQDGNAYERVKLQLLGGQNKETATPPIQSPTRSRQGLSSRVDDSVRTTTSRAAPAGRLARRMQALLDDDDDDTSVQNHDYPRPTSEEDVTEQAQQNFLSQDSEEDELVSVSQPHPTSLPRAPRSGTRSPTQSLASKSAPSPSTRPALSQHDSQSSSSDSEAPEAPSRLQALVTRKREERLAKERAAEEARQASESEDMPEQTKRPAKKPRKQQLPLETAPDDDGSADDEANQKLTQHSKPTRKASKKALEEMNRETQRMQRNMQLTHQAKTKAKFTTDDLFKKFNFRQTKPSAATEQEQLPDSHVASATASSDAERGPDVETPPSSPPSLAGDGTKTNNQSHNALTATEAPDDSDSDDLRHAFQSLREKSIDSHQPQKPKISVREFMKRAGKKRHALPSADDLELVQFRAVAGAAVLDRTAAVKPKEPHAVHALHTLAHLHEHDKPRGGKAARKSYAPSQLSAHLKQLARKQALAERDEKIQALKEKGVYVQTAEERERDQMQLENMLEKARQEAQELAQREKDAAKREGRDVDADFPDSDEDEDYVASDEEQVELSGSDDAGSQADDESEDEAETQDEQGNPLLDVAASEDEEIQDGAQESADRISEQESAEEVSAQTPAPRRVQRNRKTLVDSDDDDEDEPRASNGKTPTQARATPKTPKSALAAAFGFGQAQDAGPGLSQMFAGTMAETQDDEDGTPQVDSQQNSLDMLRGLTASSMLPSNFGVPESPTVARDSQNFIVRESPARETQFEQSQSQAADAGNVKFDTQSQLPFSETQVSASQIPEATQDEGFQTAFSPVGAFRGAPPGSHNTIDTVPLGTAFEAESPVAHRKRGLLRRGRQHAEHGPEDDDFEVPSNVFDVMRKASTKPAAETNFERNKSEAKGMVEEQAEESEDEYAGLGGASDDESAGELDDETKRQLIDDETVERLNERQVAAYFADEERADDEKRVEKLFKDIANGGLRRKRGADLELWDSDDEDEAARRRRAMKQREFAKMRRALLADDKLGKIAENPKQAAFLQAIEDCEREDEIFFLDGPEQDDSPDASASQSTSTVPASQGQDGAASTGHKRKRDDDDDNEDDNEEQDGEQESQAARDSRRAGRYTKPSTLQDIRNTLSELIGEAPEHEDDEEIVLDSQPLSRSRSASAVPVEDLDTDTPLHELGVEGDLPLLNQEHTHPRRQPVSATRKAVIDRMAVKRSRSSSLAAKQGSDAAGTRQAFFAPSAASSTSFKVPSLLRRATTNASSESMEESGLSAGGMGKEVVKMGGSKKSSVNYHVREKERRAKVEEVERSREQGRRKLGLMRRRQVGLGLGSRVGGGGFED